MGRCSQKIEQGDELDSVYAFMQWVESRHAGASEYHQAVHGVVTHLLDMVREHDGYGVGEHEIGFLFGQYKRLENQFSGALTGKSVGAGGIKLVG